MTRPERDLTEAALPPDEIPQYPPTDLPDVNRPDDPTDETTGTDTETQSDRQHRTPGNEFPSSPVD